MAKYTKDLATLLSSTIFRKISNSDTLKLVELNAAIALLIKTNIDFNLQFTSKTRRQDAEVDLTIYINPTSTISFSILLESCDHMFSEINIC